MSNFVLTKHHLWEVLIFCFNWKKSAAIECLLKFMVTLLQLINHLGNGFDVSRMEISALKTSLALNSQKIRRQRIRGITRRRSESNARGTCRIIVTQQAVSVRLRAMGMIQKQTNWMNRNRETLKNDFSLADSWFKNNREKVFCIGLWLEMRSGYSTTTPRRKNTTLSPVIVIDLNINTTAEHSWWKIMLWWDQKDLVYYELLKPGDSIIGDWYRLQLIRLSCTLQEKWPEYEQRHDKIILLHSQQHSASCR